MRIFNATFAALATLVFTALFPAASTLAGDDATENSKPYGALAKVASSWQAIESANQARVNRDGLHFEFKSFYSANDEHHAVTTRDMNSDSEIANWLSFYPTLSEVFTTTSQECEEWSKTAQYHTENRALFDGEALVWFDDATKLDSSSDYITVRNYAKSRRLVNQLNLFQKLALQLLKAHQVRAFAVVNMYQAASREVEQVCGIDPEITFFDQDQNSLLVTLNSGG